MQIIPKVYIVTIESMRILIIVSAYSVVKEVFIVDVDVYVLTVPLQLAF
jgi:hypothetical protein